MRTKLLSFVSATVISAMFFHPAALIAAPNAARVAGDLTVEGVLYFGTGGSQTSQSKASPWSYGALNGIDIGLLQGNVGIGTVTPAYPLDVIGDIQFSGNLLLPTTTATSGIIMQGGSSLLHTYGTGNFFAGKNAGNFTTTGIGLNTAIGENSLLSNTTGLANTAIGYQSLSLNTSGFQNTAVGRASMYSNTSGSFNTAIGEQSLFSNTSGGSNISQGYASLLANTTGSRNTAIGYRALESNTTGEDNTALGLRAGFLFNGNENTSGSNNTFIGSRSGPGTPIQLTNATAIGANAIVSQSNSMVLGGTGVDAVKVGIGTTAPGATLDALNIIRVLGSTPTAWPTSGIGLELAHNNVSNSGYIVSYDRSNSLWGTLDINASNVTIGGTPGNLTVTGTLNTNNIASGTWSGTTISPAKGGTGINSSTASTGSIFYASAPGTWSTLAPGTAGQILKTTAGLPSWGGVSGDTSDLLRVTGTSWPASGKGLELAHNSSSNQGYIQSYDRTGSQWGALDINASTVTIGGSGSGAPGNLAVTGVISGNGSGITNVTPVKAFAGEAGIINGSNGTGEYVFAGPTVVITTNANQQLVGSAVAVLGVNPGEGILSFSFDFGLCYRPNATSDAIINFAADDYTSAATSPAMGRKTFAAASSVVPGAGTWQVGYCVRNQSADNLDYNDWVNGWIMTVN